MKVTDALEIMTTTYQGLDSVALSLEVDANEVAKALASATPDTAEFVCLQVLAKFNPVKKKTTKQDDNNTEQ
jgi:hypothetical protein